MALSQFSKHCIASGCFALLYFVVVLVVNTIRVLELKQSLNVYPSKAQVATTFLYIGGAGLVLTIMMIIGVVKRRSLLIAPLFLGLLGACGFLLINESDFTEMFYTNRLLPFVIPALTAMAYMIFNPFLAIMKEIRMEHS